MKKTLIAAAVAGMVFTLFECPGADRAGRLSTTANTNDESP